MRYRFFQRNLLSNSPVSQLIFLESQEVFKENKQILSKRIERKRKETISDSTVKSQRIGITLKLEITKRTIALDVTDRLCRFKVRKEFYW